LIKDCNENGATQNIGKMIPQLEAQTATDTLKIFFYEPVRNMPASFSEKKNYHSIGLSKFNQQ
jgi:hypothetical protein